MKRILLVSFLLMAVPGWISARQFEPVDSVFLNSLPDFSKNIGNVIDRVWPGMHPGPVCVFRSGGPAFLMNHPDPPSNATLLQDGIYLLNQQEERLFGATQSLINGVLTAHNDYVQQRYTSLNQFYAELFHELHHVYQREEVRNLPFDNPADLLTYPEDENNFDLKHFEDMQLLEMWEGKPETFQHNLDLFYTCRKIREALIDAKYLNYEKGAESAEGPAMFCEYSYLKPFDSNRIEREYIHHRYFFALTEACYSRNKLREKCLLTGMMQCLILSKYVKNWQSEYYASGLFLYDYFLEKFPAKETVLPIRKDDLAKAKYFTGIEKQKHALNFEAFHNQQGIKLVLSFREYPEFRGFDPMHAEAINDSAILHTTLLKLGKGDNFLNLVNMQAVSGVAGQIWFVKTVELFVPEQTIRVENDNLLLSLDGKAEIKWKLVGQVKKEKEILCVLE